MEVNPNLAFTISPIFHYTHVSLAWKVAEFAVTVQNHHIYLLRGWDLFHFSNE